MVHRTTLTQNILTSLDREFTHLSDHWNNCLQTHTRFFILDNVLDPESTKIIYNAFPKQEHEWKEMASFREKKLTLAKLDRLPTIISDITFAFQSSLVMKKIEDITGHRELQADPKLYAGGISMMRKGDFLNPHIDNSHNMNRTQYRKLNLLYYVTPNWQKEFGGNLELWNSNVTEPIEIPSLFNRLVVMETNKQSWHSVNAVQHDLARCCVSNYYFAPNTKPYDKPYYHVTSFMGRPEQTSRRIVSRLDNGLRQLVATTFGISRGKELVNDQIQ